MRNNIGHKVSKMETTGIEPISKSTAAPHYTSVDQSGLVRWPSRLTKKDTCSVISSTSNPDRQELEPYPDPFSASVPHQEEDPKP